MAGHTSDKLIPELVSCIREYSIHAQSMLNVGHRILDLMKKCGIECRVAEESLRSFEQHFLGFAESMKKLGNNFEEPKKSHQTPLIS